ncbi:MAG: hypothetical protein K5651_00490 [Bacteroidales bacterium]|nr:hypothetical protein [Bacteroidales bacterium]
MEEIGMEIASQTMPMWFNVFIGIAAALGGLEFIKWVASLDIWRRKGKAEAKEADAVAHQQAATAGQKDADWRQKELDLMTSIVDTSQKQYEDLKSKYDELRADKDEDRKIKQELRLKVTEHERKIDGLQRAFTESETRRVQAERLYCSVTDCPSRHPPIGTYDSAKMQPRRKNGQFAPKKVASGTN